MEVEKALFNCLRIVYVTALKLGLTAPKPKLLFTNPYQAILLGKNH